MVSLDIRFHVWASKSRKNNEKVKEMLSYNLPPNEWHIDTEAGGQPGESLGEGKNSRLCVEMLSQSK